MNRLEQYIEDLNPIAWFDANHINGKDLPVPNDGDNVSTWKNIGSNYPDFSKINASRFPIYKKNMQNGNSAVLFTRGTSTIDIDADHLEAVSARPIIFPPYTIVVIAKPRANNNNLNGIFAHGSGGGIVMAQGKYALDYNGIVLPNTFRSANTLTDVFYCIGIRKIVSVAEEIKIGDSEYVREAFTNPRALPNQIGGRYESYTENFDIWNPRNWDGWIFESMLFEGDLALNPSRIKQIESYCKQKYNI